MASYESEHTKFMREMLARHPEWEEDQLVSRNLLWDRPVDPDEQQAYCAAKEASRPYPYDVNFGKKNG